jgi:hypothetical protein
VESLSEDSGNTVTGYAVPSLLGAATIAVFSSAWTAKPVTVFFQHIRGVDLVNELVEIFDPDKASNPDSS